MSGGRPTKLTDEIQARIVQLVEDGDDGPVAAGVCDIGRSTFFEWMDRGRSGEEPFASFRTAIACARDKWESKASKEAASGDEKGVSWGPSRAALEILKVRAPVRWAPKIKHEIVESQQLMLETLRRVCQDQSLVERVCETKDCSLVFVAVCEELSRLDGEGDSREHTGEPAAPVH